LTRPHRLAKGVADDFPFRSSPVLTRKTLALLAMAVAAAFMAAEPAMAQIRTGGGGRVPGAQPSGERVLPGRIGGDQNERDAEAARRRDRQRPQPANAPVKTPEQMRAEAQTQLTAAGVTCELTEASNPGLIGEAQVYEAACANSEGYILIASTPVQAFSCIELAGTAAIARARDPNADVGQQCLMPSNQNGVTVIGNWAREAGAACTIDEAMAIGKSDENNMVYEVGYWLEKLATGWDLKPCLQVSLMGGTCRFTTAQEQAAWFKTKLAGTDASACDVTQVRMMGSNANGSFYEAKCAAEGEGFIARVNNEGVTQQVYPCATAQRIGGGCTLTPAPAAAPATGGRP
jgi:hypothetical protein